MMYVKKNAVCKGLIKYSRIPLNQFYTFFVQAGKKYYLLYEWVHNFGIL